MQAYDTLKLPDVYSVLAWCLNNEPAVTDYMADRERLALVAQKEQGVKRKLVGFTTAERSFPRHGYPVFAKGNPSGEVRSGTMSPTLGIPIGTAYVPPDSAAEGSPLEIEIRGKRIPATVQRMPFYKHGSRL